MVWAISGLFAVAFVVVAVGAAVTRRPRTARASDVARRRDSVRIVLVLLASAIALLAGIVALDDQTIEFPPEGVLLLAAALAGAVVGLYPARGTWSDVRLSITAWVAVAWAAVGAVTLPFAVSVTACACARVGPDYLPPAPLGIEARGWIVLAVIVGPILMLLAASPLPDRFYARPSK